MQAGTPQLIDVIANDAKRSGRSQRSARTVSTATLDWIERIVVLLLYGSLVLRIATGIKGPDALINCLLLVSEGVVVLLVLIRRRTENISPRPIDWVMAFIATTTALLVQPGGSPLIPSYLAAGMMLAGFLIQVHAKISLGRSFGCVAANRGLKFCGPYRFIRHPMYFGYLLAHLGFLLVNPTVWNAASYALCYSMQIPRLLCEERLLSNDPNYQRYTTLVHFRLIPGIF